MARPLATAYKSIKTQTQKLLPLFNSITARKTACNSAYQANLSSPSSEWWKMLSIHLGTTIHKPSSFLFVGYELFYRLLPKWQQNPSARRTVPGSVPGEKRLSALEYLPSPCTPQTARSYMNHFRFITDSSGQCPLYCSLSDITWDIMSVSGFEIILWLLVIMAVSINVQ